MSNILLPEEFNHVMCDIETGATTPDAHIAQIALGLMNFQAGRVEMAFEVTVDCATPQPGRVLDAATMAWWADPSRAEAFKQVWKQTDQILAKALYEMVCHLDSIMLLNGKPIMLWSKGVSFDITILTHALKQAQLVWPVGYRDISDYRTIARMHKALTAEAAFDHYGVRMPDTYHTAFADVEYQALHLMYIAKYYHRA